MRDLPDWMDDRACRYLDPAKFDASAGEQPITARVLSAKATCRACPVRVECQEFGMNEDFGVYGGLAPIERKRLREDRANAARRKTSAGS